MQDAFLVLGGMCFGAILTAMFMLPEIKKRDRCWYCGRWYSLRPEDWDSNKKWSEK